MKYIKIVLVIASILVGLFLIGFTIGKIKSPDYSKKSYVEDGIEKKSFIKFGGYKYRFIKTPKKYKSLSSDSNSMTLIMDTLVISEFPTGRYSYVYLEKSGIVNKVNNLSYTAGDHKKRLSKEDYTALFATMGVTGGFTLKNVGTVSKSNNVWITAITIITGAGTFIYGYKKGYSDDLDPDNELTQKVLNDPIFWEGVIARKKPYYIPLTPFIRK